MRTRQCNSASKMITGSYRVRTAPGAGPPTIPAVIKGPPDNGGAAGVGEGRGIMAGAGPPRRPAVARPPLPTAAIDAPPDGTIIIVVMAGDIAPIAATGNEPGPHKHWHAPFIVAPGTTIPG